MCAQHAPRGMQSREMQGAHVTNDPEKIDRTFEALFELYASGRIAPVIFKRYSLEDVPAALESLASRKTYGKLVITP